MARQREHQQREQRDYERIQLQQQMELERERERELQRERERNERERERAGMIDRFPSMPGPPPPPGLGPGPSSHQHRHSTHSHPHSHSHWFGHTVAIAYVMQKTPYVFPIVGGRKVEHLHDNIKALEISLTPEQTAFIDGVVPFDPGFPHYFIVCLSRRIHECND